jgi:hypothetical protein
MQRRIVSAIKVDLVVVILLAETFGGQCNLELQIFADIISPFIHGILFYYEQSNRTDDEITEFDTPFLFEVQIDICGPVALDPEGIGPVMRSPLPPD